MFGISKQLKESQGSGYLSPLKNPFEKNKFKSLNIHVFEDIFNEGSFKISGTINFKNGATSGCQDFKAASIPELLQQMQIFLENL